MTDSNHRAIAIDGPAASGKSTVAKRLAKTLGLIMVNSGDMYRAVTKAALDHSINPDDPVFLQSLLEKITLTCAIDDQQRSSILIDGIPLGESLRSGEVNAHVSQIASIPEVRKHLVDLQRTYLKQGDLVMEGRDIGTVVFPDTPFKIFIDADEKTRSQRRSAEGLADSISQRDQQDKNRKTSPLTMATGAVRIDSTDLTIDEVVTVSLEILNKLGWKTAS